jgi:hypothetical protein
MERRVTVFIDCVDVGSKADKPGGSVLRLVITGIVQRSVLPLVEAGHAEAGLLMQIRNHVRIVIIGCLVHEIDATLVLDGQIGPKLLNQVEEHLVVLLASQVKGCPAVVRQGVQVDPVADDFVDLQIHLFFTELFLEVRGLPLPLLGLHHLSLLEHLQGALLDLGHHVLEYTKLPLHGTKMNQREAHVVQREDQVVYLHVTSIFQSVLESGQVLILYRLKQLDICAFLLLLVVILPLLIIILLLLDLLRRKVFKHCLFVAIILDFIIILVRLLLLLIVVFILQDFMIRQCCSSAPSNSSIRAALSLMRTECHQTVR